MKYKTIMKEFMGDAVLHSELQNYSRWCKENNSEESPCYIDERKTLDRYLKEIEQEIIDSGIIQR
jgi:hypothetical protein